MATNKHASIRYQALDKCFRNRGRKFFIEDLILACNVALYEFTGSERYSDDFNPGVSRRQIFEDIKYMESRASGWEIPLERLTDGKKVYYRYSDKNYSINNQPLTDEEMTQLREMTFLLNRFKGLPQCEWMEELVTNLEDKFKIKGSSKSVISMESNAYAEGLKYLSPIFNAIINKQVLHIVYSPFNKPDCEWDIHPYFVKQYNNRWFLLGLNNKDYRISNIGLDRIKSFDNSSIQYIEDNIIEDIDEYFADVIGVTIPQNKDVVNVKLQFSEKRYPYIASKPLHESMRFIDRENRIVSIDVIPNKELESLILSFGDDVEVLEPHEFRKQIATKIKANFMKYFAVQNDCTESYDLCNGDCPPEFIGCKIDKNTDNLSMQNDCIGDL